jgi:hypothetical protein
MSIRRFMTGTGEQTNHFIQRRQNGKPYFTAEDAEESVKLFIIKLMNV